MGTLASCTKWKVFIGRRLGQGPYKEKMRKDCFWKITPPPQLRRQDRGFTMQLTSSFSGRWRRPVRDYLTVLNRKFLTGR